MNFLRNSRRLLSHQHHQKARLLLTRPSQMPTAGFTPLAIHRRRYCCTASPPSPARCPWHHDPRKVAALSVLAAGAALMAFRRRYLEFVPCTNRAHLVLVASPQSERELGESDFAEYKQKMASQILGPLHPDSVRVRLIARKIIHAANRGLGVMDHDDAVMLRVTMNLNQAGKPSGPRPQTTHLHGLNWEVILVADSTMGANATCMPGGKVIVSTGLLDGSMTDGDIAAVIAHEIAHIIARHDVDIVARSKRFLPIFLLPHFSRRMETGRLHWNPATRCRWFRTTHSPCILCQDGKDERTTSNFQRSLPLSSSSRRGKIKVFIANERLGESAGTIQRSYCHEYSSQPVLSITGLFLRLPLNCRRTV